MVKRLQLCVIGTFLLLQAGVREAQAAEISIVSPSAYEHWEGEELVGDGCCPPYRYQQVFPAEDFAALGNQPHWIVGYAWRPDESVTSPRTVQFPDNEVRLSTTERGPDNLSLHFDDNLGSDVTQFYRGPLTAVADAQGPGPGPREFYRTEFPAGVIPYLYDPSQGNLLFDVIAWQGESPSGRADQIRGIRASLYASNPLATQGEQVDSSIFQFTFVPMLLGDYNQNGAVEQGDLDLVLLNWGRELSDPAAIGWVHAPPSGRVDQGELDGVLLNWGIQPGALGSASVPEPSSFVLLVVLVLLGSLCPRSSTSRSRPIE